MAETTIPHTQEKQILEKQTLEWQNLGTEHLRRPEGRIAADLNEIASSGGLPGDKNARVLCVGCRDAYEMYLLNAVHGYTNLAGVDISRKMVALALLLSDFDVQWDDAQELRTIRSQEFSAVLCLHALEHLVSPQSAISAMHRALCPGGTLSVIVPQEETASQFHVRNYSSLDDLESVVCGGGEFPRDSIMLKKQFPTDAGIDDLMIIVRKA